MIRVLFWAYTGVLLGGMDSTAQKETTVPNWSLQETKNERESQILWNTERRKTIGDGGAID